MHFERSNKLYSKLIEAGVKPEQARIVLPQSMYTEFIETGNLASYARLYKLRIDKHAQLEIRQYAQVIDQTMAELYPVA
jgi:thymidylate synthase (FAD)